MALNQCSHGTSRKAIREDFNLCHGEVTVSHHFLEAFLIKFKHAHHYTAALQKGKATGAGVEVHFTKWRSLRDAEGAMLLFCGELTLQNASSVATAPWKPSTPTWTGRRKRRPSTCRCGWRIQAQSPSVSG